MLEQVIDIFDVNTDAVATNKGFYYQYLITLKKWISNFIEDNEIEAYSEVDQDIKEVGHNWSLRRSNATPLLSAWLPKKSKVPFLIFSCST